MLPALRIIAIFVWAGVALFMSPAVWALIRGRPQRADPSRLAWFSVAMVQLLGNLRWIFAPDSEQLWQAVYVLLIATGLYVMHAARSYGRGPRI